MNKDNAIKIARDKNSTPDQLKTVLGISDEVDLLLAKNPNTTEEMLNDICWRQSYDDKIAPVALVHPNLNVDQLLDVGIEYPLAAYKNPKFAVLVEQDKKYLDKFDGKAFENSFKKALPDFVVEWLLTRGKEVYQLTYVSAPRRSPEELLRFRKSKHPKVIASLLTIDIDTYRAWAEDVGFELEPIGLFPPAEVRARIDGLITQIVQGTLGTSPLHHEQRENLFLPKELFAVLVEIESKYFKNGRVAFPADQNFYVDFIDLLNKFFANFTKAGGLASRVVEYDLGEVKRFCMPGKRPPPKITSATYYEKSELDRSFHRLWVALARCCQLRNDNDWTSLCRKLEILVSANALPSAEVRSTMEGNVMPHIPRELLDSAGVFKIESMFANKSLDRVVADNPSFLSGFKGPKFEKALRAKNVPDFVVRWLLAQGSFEQQATFLFATSRAPEVLATFRDSKHERIIAQLLLRDDATYLAWANNLGFEMPTHGDDEQVEVRSEVDTWVELLDGKNTQRWKDLVPSEGVSDTLQGELIRAIGRLQIESFKNGMMNWGDGGGHYEGFTKLIHGTLKAEPSFSNLVKAVIDADVLEIRQAGKDGKSMASGKPVQEQEFGKDFLISSDVDMSMQRLGAVIGIWCQLHPDLIPYSG